MRKDTFTPKPTTDEQFAFGVPRGHQLFPTQRQVESARDAGFRLLRAAAKQLIERGIGRDRMIEFTKVSHQSKAVRHFGAVIFSPELTDNERIEFAAFLMKCWGFRYARI